MILLISSIVLLALAFANVFITKHVLHPSDVYAGIWSMQLIGRLLFRNRFIDPSLDVLLIVVLGAVMFTIGAHFSSLSVVSLGRMVRPRRVRRHPTLLWIFAVLVAIC